MLIAHRIAVDPTDKQRTYFARASGAARFAWNCALAEWQRQYAASKEDPSLRRQLNSLQREQFPWMFDLTKCAAQEAIIDLRAGFRSFFEKRGRRFRRAAGSSCSMSIGERRRGVAMRRVQSFE